MNNLAEPALLHAPVVNLDLEIRDKAALITQKHTLSYSELHQSAVQGAHWFIANGCKPGDCVGICLPKNQETVMAIFAILCAGAIFLPIDPGAPPARVAYILGDAGATRVFTHPHMADALTRLEHPPSAKITILDGNGSFQSLISDSDTDTATLPGRVAEDTALLYYTSGTTGSPKAIMLSHANVTSFTEWAISTFDINGDDRVASHAPFHFDLSTLDLFAATRVGASVVLLDEASIMFPARISRLIESGQISVWYSVPTALIQLQRHGYLDRRDLSTLRLVLFAGEVFPVTELTRLMEKLPHCEYANLYGPTETNVCTYYRITSPPSPDAKDVPIGIACEHLDVHLYHEDGTVPAAGEQGEIVVFGPAVMQGYLNQPELTANSRFNGDNNSYRTGDIAYRDDSGLLHLVGRKDDQVKIRGHRIELMEVTSVLNKHPAVMEAVAELSGLPDGDAEIIAFIAPETNQSITIETVHEYCRQWLPRYAIPKRVLILGSLPRTATGKIDRQKLKQHPDLSA